MEIKVHRSETNRVLAGVCGGLAEYFNVDASLVRVAWGILAASGTGIVAYIICALIFPKESDQ